MQQLLIALRLYSTNGFLIIMGAIMVEWINLQFQE